MANNTNRRALIKTIAIVFLVVLLLLTLFSNTIMNQSLPQVSAQYAAYDTISTAVKLSGTVKAKESYAVIYEAEAAEDGLPQTRTVVSVYVKVGDTVEKGAPLLALKGGASEQLAAAERTLAEKQAEYDLALLQDKVSSLESGSTVTAARQALDDLKKELARLRETYSALTASGDGAADPEEQIGAYEAQQKELTKRKDTVDGKITELTGRITTLTAQLEFDLSDRSHAERLQDANETFADLEVAYLKLKNDTEAAKTAWDTLKDTSSDVTEWGTIYESILSLEEQIDALEKADIRAREDYVDSLKQAARTDAFAEGETAGAESGGTAAAVTARLQFLDTEVFETIERIVCRSYDWENVLDKVRDALESGLAKNGVFSEDAAVQAEIDAYLLAIEAPARAHRRSMEDSDAQMTKLSARLNEERRRLQLLGGDINSMDGLTADSAARELAEAEKNYNALNEQLAAAETEYQSAKSEVATLQTLVDCETKLTTYEAEAARIEDTLEELSALLSPLEGSDLAAFLHQIEEKERAVAAAEIDLQKAEAGVNVDAMSTKQAREKQLREIEELKAKVEAYKAAPENTEITAPIAGRVTELEVVPGNTLSSGATAARIEVAEKGYLCEITVSSEEARKIQVGAECSITNSWWSDLTATVTQVRADPQSQGKNRIVVIELAGDVNEGQTLNFTVGDRSQSYGSVLPNSAIREDAEGKFVLVVESKSTPLGVRYTAVRYQVEVTASDDTKSAVSGLMGGEFVITNASSPVADGQQVRLAES